MKQTPDTLSAFAPTGRLRASINVGNPILARRGPDGVPVGVSIDLAHAFARSLGVPLSLVVFDSAGKSVDAVTQDEADIGFFAIDPARGEGVFFTGPYVLIEGAYLVRNDSALQSNDAVDRAGHRVMVGKGSAYDLFLTRELRAATIMRAPTSPAVVEAFLNENVEVAAGVKQQLQAEAARLGGLRLLPGSFMTIRQAMGVPRSRGPAAAQVLGAFVEEMKRTGSVRDALARHDIEGATVASLVG